MNKTVIAFGEVLWDLLPGEKLLGGAPGNFIYRVNTLGDKGTIISRLGSDQLGDKAFTRLQELGLDTIAIQRDTTAPTGTVKVFFDDEKNPDYEIIAPVAYDNIEASANLEKLVEKSDCFCFGTVAQRSEQSRGTLLHLLTMCTGLKLFDLNLRKNCYSQKVISDSLERATYFKLNEDEVGEMAKMFGLEPRDFNMFMAQATERWNLECVLITLGHQGVLALKVGGPAVYSPGFKIELADSLGAGDSFTAGCMHKLLSGATLEESCEFGNILGALVASKAGATPLLKDKEIETFKNEFRDRSVDKRFTHMAESQL